MIGARDDWWQIRDDGGAAVAGARAFWPVPACCCEASSRCRTSIPGFDPDGLAMVNVQMTTNRLQHRAVRRWRSSRISSSGSRRSAHGSDDRWWRADVRRRRALRTSRRKLMAGSSATSPGRSCLACEVGSDYFTTVRIPVDGRPVRLRSGDGAECGRDQRQARRVITGARPRRSAGASASIAKEPWLTVVGVVGDVKQMSLTDPWSHGMEVYFPQFPESRRRLLFDPGA